MKVALVHDYLHSFGGAEQVLLSFSELFPDAPIYTFIKDLKCFPSGIKEVFEKKDIRTSMFSKIPVKKSMSKFLVPITKNWFEKLDLSEYDLIISDGTIWSKGVKTNNSQFHIYYCHTPARFLYGFPTELGGKRNIPILKSLIKIVENNLREWDLITSNNPDVIIANSKNVQDRIKNFWNKESKLVYPPVNGFSKDLNVKKQDYYLVVSRLEPYKNVDKVVEAFNLLGWKLKIIGRGSEKVSLKMMANHNIEFIEGVSREELEKIYKGAKGIILSAEEEDFGITAIESASVGVPVVALRSGGFKETVIEGVTGVFYEENSVGSMLEAIKNLDSMEFDSNAIINEVQDKYTKQKFKVNFMRVVNEVVNINKNL